MYFRFQRNNLTGLILFPEKGRKPLPVPRNRAVLHPLTGREDQHSPEEVLFIQTVVYPFPLFPILDETGVFERAEMKRHLGLRHVQSCRDIADA